MSEAEFYPMDETIIVPFSDATCLRAIHNLRWRLAEMLVGGPEAVVVDLTGLTGFSSTTIAALLWAKRRCGSRGVPLRLRNADPALAGQLRRAGLDTIWDIQTAPAASTPTRKAN
ncbi:MULTISPECIES: STAS domain-containing protein [unclassified Nocardioides]|jgi:anti-anti-sigma factor|uniref:STAS domain-containing protein n=1 Tax=unclassified Nocardioides TaxID=2615069 RepID=UPI001989484C|nr:STAS domain-containing protein [Nocardioides sp.]MBC7275964.1 STAS domain-containing protein [Nocardioides sp.]